MTEPAPRTSTPLDRIADEYVGKVASLSPLTATSLGVPGDERAIDDFSPEGRDAVANATRETLRRVEATEPLDDVDTVTRAAMIERLSLELELHDAGEGYAELNNISSPLQGIRSVFDLMPNETDDDWADIAARMQAVPDGVDGYIASLRHAASRADGPFPARRQIDIGVDQARELARHDGFWGGLAAGADVPATLAADLTRGADAARAAYKRLAVALAELHDRAPEDDAVGRERYERFSRSFLGAAIDLDETYEWGRAELTRIIAEQDEIAHQLYGDGTTTPEAMAKLDADITRQLHGTDALQRWMQETSDAAIEALAGSQFDIPEQLRRLECRIAPTQDGGIYYTGPSADFSRPGRMWWSVPPGVETFSTWQEKTTVYHEGVPGHHLQIGQAVYRASELNKWRSLLCWVSGHGEGWALYAERLMADLGFQDEPGDRMGMLDSQRLRAARVVLDIGVHLGKEFPGGGTWNADKAWGFLRENVSMQGDFLRFELDRYLGWPGQAPSYKVGQRLWEQARDAAAAREGANFDLKGFHRRALDLGSVGLDVLQEALRRA
ncbi:Uncharacterized conserved protein, DUF885 familyt [Tessaracoccus bendigoensis DSM 12906]|uniref:Uncharacterized conserved protein, DUF885 familyt n=1 Tax=Tessaracoccus bendigoensis DSM 12906 TaxID=1123357 RepID=A0A1M6B772_9ACTN|nr:DUF885 domain-containing protein [Tessaracoccus bendigoensis]SHI44599.1 Uncharacterized conserved protein, DUF885 familyt [Tessaracoccus bendigoensis DSM 12906]